MTDDTSDILPVSSLKVTAGTLTRIQKCCLFLYLVAFACAVILATLFLWEYRGYNSPEYRLDTDHLRWRSPIPAVSVCQRPDATSYGRRISPGTVTSKDLSQVVEFLNGLVMPDTRYCTGCERHCSLCPTDDYKHHVDKATKSCRSLFKRCVWDRTEFDCCDNFRPLPTRGGKCFSINSQQSDGSGTSEELSVGSRGERGVMKLTMTVPVQIYLHDNKDVGFIEQPSKHNEKRNDKSTTDKVKGQKTEITYRYYEVRVDQSAWDLTADKRRCALPGERGSTHHNKYSRSACRTECRLRKQSAVCNCTHHLLPTSDNVRTCDLQGLRCLDRHFKDGLKETKRKLRLMGISCDCPPECDVTEINIVHSAVTETNDGEISAVITLQSPPTQRLTLAARVTWLDVIVGVACFSRLFTSASVPSVARAACYVATRFRCRRPRTSEDRVEDTSDGSTPTDNVLQ